MSATKDYKYNAFISYSHQDKTWGDWLHKSLEKFSVPKALRGKPNRTGTVPKSLFPIFRDREELPTATDLGAVITHALQDSAYLIVICSPRSAKSMWVNQEILHFKRLGRSNRVLAIIVDGEPNGANKPGMEELECFPEALKYEIDEQGELTNTPTEPLAADARANKDGKQNALLKLAAGVLGVNFNDLKQREKIRQRNRRLMIGAAASLFLATGIGYWQYAQQIEQERLLEESAKLTSESLAALEDGNTKLAVNLALEALPEALAEPDRPYYPEAEAALSRALYQHSELNSVEAHNGAVRNVTADPSGNYIYSAGDEGKVKQWHAESLEFVKDVLTNESAFYNMVMHPNDPLLVTWDEQNQVKIWDLNSSETIFQFSEFGSIYSSKLTFSEDGRYLTAGSYIWDKQNNQLVDVSKLLGTDWVSVEKAVPVTGSGLIAFNVSNNDEHDLYLVDPSNDSTLRKLTLPENHAVGFFTDYTDLGFVHQFSSGSLVVTNSEGESLYFTAENYLATLPHQFTSLLEIDPASDSIVMFSDQSDSLFRVSGNSPELSLVSDAIDHFLMQGHSRLHLLPDNNKLLVQSDKLLEIHDVLSGDSWPVFSFQETEQNLFSVNAFIRNSAISSDGSIAYLALRDGSIKTFDLQQYSQMTSLMTDEPIKRVKFSPNGKSAALLTSEGKLHLLSLSEQSLTQVTHELAVEDVQFLYDNRLAFIDDSRLYIVSGDNYQSIQSFEPFTFDQELDGSLRLSASAKRAAVHSSSGTQRVFDAETNAWLSEQIKPILTAAEYATDKVVLQSSSRHIERLTLDLTLADSYEIPPLAGANLPLSDVYVSDNGNYSLWADVRGNLTYYNLVSGETIEQIALTDPINALALSRNGQHALVATSSQLIVLKHKNKGFQQKSRDGYIFQYAALQESTDTVLVIEKQYDADNLIVSALSLENQETIWQKPFADIPLLKVLPVGDEFILVLQDSLLLLDVESKSIARQINPFAGEPFKLLDTDASHNALLLSKDNLLYLGKFDSDEPPVEIGNYFDSYQLFIDSANAVFALIANNTARVYSLIDGQMLATNWQHYGLGYGFNDQGEFVSWYSNGLLCQWNWQADGDIGSWDNPAEKSTCIRQYFNNGSAIPVKNELFVFKSQSHYSILDSDLSISATTMRCDAPTPIYPTNPHSKSVICQNNDNSYQLLDVDKQTISWPFEDSSIGLVLPNHNGQFLLALNLEGDVYFADINEPSSTKKLTTQNNMQRVAISDNGSTVAILNTDWTIALWDTISGQLVKEFQANINDSYRNQQHLMLLNDNMHAVLLFEGGDIFVIGDSGVKAHITLTQQMSQGIFKVSIKHDRVFHTSWDAIQVWDLTSGNRLDDIPLESGLYNPNKLTIDEHNGYLWVQQDSTTVYSLSTLAPIATFPGYTVPQNGSISSGLVAFIENEYAPQILFHTFPQGELFSSLDSTTLNNSFGIASDGRHRLLYPGSKRFLSISPNGLYQAFETSSKEANIAELGKLFKSDNPSSEDWIVAYNRYTTSLEFYDPFNGEVAHTIDVQTQLNHFGNDENERRMVLDDDTVIYKTGDFNLHIANVSNFSEAAQLTLDAGKIMDFDWDNSRLYAITKSGELHIWNNDGQLMGQFNNNWVVNDDDVIGIDAQDNITAGFKGPDVFVWNTNGLGLIGELDSSADIYDRTVAIKVNTEAMHICVIKQSGKVSFLPLLPSGQALIDLAEQKVMP